MGAGGGFISRGWGKKRSFVGIGKASGYTYGRRASLGCPLEVETVVFGV